MRLGFLSVSSKVSVEFLVNSVAVGSIKRAVVVIVSYDSSVTATGSI